MSKKKTKKNKGTIFQMKQLRTKFKYFNITQIAAPSRVTKYTQSL